MALLSKIYKFKIVIDFHNYGYTILNLNTKIKFIVFLAKIYEKYFAKFCDYAFCVSQAM
jgi:beta-1,4-mannosyltransferase